MKKYAAIFAALALAIALFKADIIRRGIALGVDYGITILCAECSKPPQVPDPKDLTSVVLERFVEGQSEGAVEVTDPSGIQKAFPSPRVWGERVSQGSNAETPSSRTYMRISLHSEKSEARRLFLYKKDGLSYIEEARTGVYAVDIGYPERIDGLWHDTPYIKAFGGMMATGKFALPKNHTGKNQAAALFRDKDGNETGYFHMLPEKRKAASPADARYLVFGAYGKELTGKYRKMSDGMNADGTPVTRASAYRIIESVSIYDLSSGRMIAEKTFKGGEPPEKVYENTVVKEAKEVKIVSDAYGTAPDRAEIKIWIEAVLDGASPA